MKKIQSLVDDRKKRIRKGLQDALQCLFSHVESLFQSLKSTRLRSTPFVGELESVYSFLETLILIQDSMPDDRFREAIRKSSLTLYNQFRKISPSDRAQFEGITVDPRTDSLDFLSTTFSHLGPSIRLSPNEMKAWIIIQEEDAPFFTCETVIASLKKIGIVAGIASDTIEKIFHDRLWEEEVCIAQGIPAMAGTDGYIKYLVDIDDLSLVPKELSAGRVSFKDVNLFNYISSGQPIAQKIAPVPGKPGLTITNRTLKPMDPLAAEFPAIENTVLSEDKLFLQAAMDGCLSKRGGKITLEPTLRIGGNVSYKTGNLDSRVTVYVTQDIQSDFSVKTDKDLYVQGLIEGATIEVKGELVIKGGVQGKGKAIIEANSNISAKFIANASVNSLGSVLVDGGITNCVIWAAGNVVLSGRNAELVGGEIHADGEVIAEAIGSDLGVKTKIILGERMKELSTLQEEVQQKITQQEEVETKCTQIIDTLEFQSNNLTMANPEIEAALKRANLMLSESEKNLEALNMQMALLQTQYEESLKQIRTIRVRKTIYPGSILTIQDISLEVKRPTGPVIVVKQDNELITLPYTEPNQPKEF
ncbi:MAG: FapA family protein [bacterium]|jgi:uncharacterized protein (DUF342 family)|nr:FapA family protein [bacterium]